MDAMHNKYDHLVGKVIDDRYEVLQVKGIGGMAVVLKAKDKLKNRTVAIKMLNEKNSNDTAAVRRFVNESRAIALLSNDHIVDIYDVAFTGKSKYIVMEYIDGITLREYMKRNAPLSIDTALDFSIQILTALQHAHEKGVVHRDIKPQNIMVQSNGKLKVTDFGIAEIRDSKQQNSGVAMGTVYYISPEQASGKTTTFSSDIYSVGIMLYEMATGKLPFEGDTPLSIAMMQVNTKPVRPRKIDSKIPQGLEQIILRAMNKAPENRFRSAKSMLRACDIIKKDRTVVFEETKPASNTNEKTAAEKDKTAKHTTPRTLFPIILGVTTAFLLVMLVAGIILLTSLINMTSEDNTLLVTIPDLVSKEVTDELKASLEAQNIILEITEINNDYYAKGQIATQNPLAGQTRKVANKDKMVTVEVEVSLGKSSFTLEDYVNKEYREVQIALDQLGANVVVEEKFDSAVIAGFIISTAPEKGATVNSGDTVTLYVSKGAETAFSDMINVMGEKVEKAKNMLLNANFVVGNITKEYSDAEEGTVTRQSIAPGVSTAQKYTAVDLTVSMGPRPGTTTPAEPAVNSEGTAS